jgi:hypothetical protein
MSEDGSAEFPLDNSPGALFRGYGEFVHQTLRCLTNQRLSCAPTQRPDVRCDDALASTRKARDNLRGSFNLQLGRKLCTLASALPTLRLSTGVHARDDPNSVLANNVEDCVRKASKQSATDVSVHDWVLRRIRGNRAETIVHRVKKASTQA